jgi:hypothetical protein
VNGTAGDGQPDVAAHWPNITALLSRSGHITIGTIAHIDGVAVAALNHKLVATLVRQTGEPIDALLRRLDTAIGEALGSGVPTNEIENGYFILAGPN